jgi:uncharacterized protein (DUF2062 family)
MLFKRRTPATRLHRMRQMVWPKMGWGRTYHYVRHRLLRARTGPREIVGGLAIGIAVSFTPLLGTHLLQAFVLCWALRFNLLAGATGTLIGNPWTFPFIFWMNYKIGESLFEAFGWVDVLSMPEKITLSFMLEHPLRLMLPMLFGGVVSAIVAFFAAYVLLYYPVRGMQRAYHLQKIHRHRASKRRPS